MASVPMADIERVSGASGIQDATLDITRAVVRLTANIILPRVEDIVDDPLIRALTALVHAVGVEVALNPTLSFVFRSSARLFRLG